MPTRRWTPILEKGIYGLRGERKRYYESTTRFQIVPAGRRSLKTEIMKRKIVEAFLFGTLENFKGYFDERYIYSAPTRDQAERIGWNDLKALCPPQYVKRIWEGDLCIEGHFGKELWVVGLDKPARIEGQPLDMIGVDEFPDIPKGAWEANIRPALSDRNGKAILAGVPDFEKPNNDKFQELFELGLSGKNPEYDSFTWKSRDVLPDSEIESARADLSPILFAQEYEASFETAPGRAYSAFSRNVHVDDEKAVYNPELPLRVSCDFNIEHHNWGLYQITLDGTVLAFDEIYLRAGETEFMIKDLRDRISQLNPREVVFYGDYSGENRSAAATRTNWRQIRDAFPMAEFKYKKQPAVASRISKVNSKLMNANGEVHFYVNSKCKNLIRDLEKVTRTMLFSQQKGDELSHASDALGYCIVQFRD